MRNENGLSRKEFTSVFTSSLLVAWWLQNFYLRRGAWLGQSVECGTLDLGVIVSDSVFGVEITLKKSYYFLLLKKMKTKK